MNSFHVSLRSIDLGFDPRCVPPKTCLLPPGIEAVLYDRRPVRGVVSHDGSCIATGSAAEIQAKLSAHGYRIVWEKTFRHQDLDGQWNRLTDDGYLEMRDPNDGLGFNPKEKSRWQLLRTEHGQVWTRRLPAEGNDRWRDAVTPEDMPVPWEMVPIHLISTWGLVLDYLRWADTDSWQCWRPAPLPRITAGDCHDPQWILADYTANGREIRWSRKTGLYEVQPPRDNYWKGFRTLAEARGYFQKKGGKI